MLKWLVTRGPSSPSSLENEVTDDPLATIGRRNKKHDPIYAVSRVNPIFEEDGKGITTVVIETGKQLMREKTSSQRSNEIPESPPTDRDSVQSSGYGSKEADSVSYKSDSQEDEEEDEEELSHSKANQADSKDKNTSVRRRPRSSSTGAIGASFQSPGSVSELRRSFENLSVAALDVSRPFLVTKTSQVDIVHQNIEFVKSIEIGSHNSNPSVGSLEVIPEASESAENSPSKSPWPRVSQLAETLQRQADRIHQRRERERLKRSGHDPEGSDLTHRNSVLRFNPLVSVVTQDSRYVTGISVSPKGKLGSVSINNPNNNDSCVLDSNFQNANRPIDINLIDSSVPSYFKQSNSASHNEFPLLSFQPDSLITEETLRMMNFPDFHQSLRNQEEESIYEISPSDMPDFGRAIYSGFYSTNKSSSSSSQGGSIGGKTCSSSQGSIGGKSRTSVNSCNRTCAKKKGVSVVKDLWEKSGLKTNGRKLLVDVIDLLLDQDKTSLPVYRKSSYGSTAEEYRSLHSTVGNGSSQYRRLGTAGPSTSNRSSNTYEEVYGYPHHSSGAYEDISVGERGIDNPVFIDDGGLSTYSAPLSLHSKAGFQFQHNLTDFQKRVGENGLGESSHRKSWLDIEKGTSSQSLVYSSSSEGSCQTNELIRNGKNGGKGVKKTKNIPGKAVREFGLDEGGWKSKNNRGFHDATGSSQPWSSGGSFQRNQGYIPDNFGHQNRQQFWDYQYGQNFLDGNISGTFSPHPNSAALVCREDGTPCQDFTLDAKRSHRILQKSSKSEKRKRCCSFVVVIVAFVVFVGVIVGVSWYYTGGQRLFGPM